ncbi:hypothetical protein MRX96_007186 [Rhipicephalus microplus]
MLTRLFVFVGQDLHGMKIPLRGHRCLIEEAVLSLVPTPPPARTSVTSATSDLPTAIRSHVPPSNLSGPGNGTLDFVSCLHVAMRCFCGVNERVYVNDHPNRCPRCSTRCLCYNRLDGTVPPFGPADSFVDVSTSC